MPAPGEHKTVQARILAYAQEIGWRYVPRAEAEARRGFDPDAVTPEERARKASLFFGDLLHAKVRVFNPKYKDAEGALTGEFQRFRADIYGNRDFLQALRNQHKFFCAEETRREFVFSAIGDRIVVNRSKGAPLLPMRRMRCGSNGIHEKPARISASTGCPSMKHRRYSTIRWGLLTRTPITLTTSGDW
jgi:hypothetical protein